MILDTPTNRAPGSLVTGIRFTLEQPPFAGQAFDVALRACATRRPQSPCRRRREETQICATIQDIVGRPGDRVQKQLLINIITA